MQGYKIFFFQLPASFVKRSNSFARENSDFVSQAVSDLLRLDLMKELACKPNIIKPLSVSTRSSEKQRLSLDLRHVNQFIYKQNFFSLFGGPILLTGLLVLIMLNYQDLTQDFFQNGCEAVDAFFQIGGTIIIGFVLQCVY